MIIKLFQIDNKSQKMFKYFCLGNPYALRLLLWNILKYKKYTSFINNKISITISALKEMLTSSYFLSIKLLCDESKESVEFYFDKAFRFVTKSILQNKDPCSFSDKLNSKLKQVKLFCKENSSKNNKIVFTEKKYNEETKKNILQNIESFLDSL